VTDFAEKFKAARKAAGLTQQGMEDQMQIPRRTVQDWEKGIMTPPPYVQALVLEKLEGMRAPKKKDTETVYKVFGLTSSGAWRTISPGTFRSLTMAEIYVEEHQAGAKGHPGCQDYKIMKRTITSTVTEWADV
jgi:DNA-binding XRE family transcriptional regulator